MSPITDKAATEWLNQLNTMRAMIAELGITPTGMQEKEDLEWDYGGSPVDDFWDLISETGDEEDYDRVEDCQSESEPPAATGVGSRQWLQTQCEVVSRAGNMIYPDVLLNQILEILSSNDSDDALQMTLADLVGFDHLDLVGDIIQNRKRLVEEPQTGNKLLSRAERDERLRQADRAHKNALLAPAQTRTEEQYPHVYRAHNAANVLSPQGRAYLLPAGSERTEHSRYEEYSIPATKIGTLAQQQKLVRIKDLDGLCRETFKGYETLNRMQSLVYPVAYQTSENMLICAPTGAGKTDAAMLTILNTVAKCIHPNPIENPDAVEFAAHLDDFKIVYVAPMKALAAEVTEKLGKRLAWLGIKVRELTGDMQLTKAEIVATQIIVTTPEKWDVVTRKSTGDTELVQKVRLLIIDEVHMLHDERGAVLESLVARTERQVESTQSLIRIVGLSATLPNFVDVADFLKVNCMAGLFYFDQSFRPVPLEQHFLGIKGKPAKVCRENMEVVAFQKVKEMLEAGHQVMVFVHSRKDTYKTARQLLDMAADEGVEDLFDTSGIEGYTNAMRDVKSSKSREIRDLVTKVIGTHHAGMARSDRNFVERLFGAGLLRVLCCTATLAWGVNLPAAAVIIKGTQLYSAEAGKFVDLGILDVLQIFGRAGRPQFQDTGIGMIITTHDKLQHYLNAVTQQQPIESQFSRKLVDNLNAEISLGTVTSITEAITWLGYSYLYVRMRHNPTVYGIEWSEIQNDPNLVQRRRELIVKAARTLQQSQMIIFNEITEELRAKDVGRIASQFYVSQASIEVFNQKMNQRSTEDEILAMLAMSGEFANIQARESEESELKRLRDIAPCKIPPRTDDKQAKTNVLLQAHISQARLEDFTLVSDMAYVAQNAARIARALFMIALNRRWGYQCLVLLDLCKSIEKRLWWTEHPLRQFDLPHPVLRQLESKSSTTSVRSLRDMEAGEIGSLVHNHKLGGTISKLLDNFPTLSIEAEMAPLNRDVLRIKLFITPDFIWNDRHHGTSESYWIWAENSESSEIYHHEFFILNRKKLHDDHELNFTIPLSDPLPSQIYVRAVSDRWLGAETVHAVSFQHLIRPDTESVYTDLLNLHPLPIKALKNDLLEEIYGQRFQYFNPMQTQLFHCMYYTSSNVLLGSPTGSGKTVAAELAMWQALRDKPGSKVVYIAPMKALVRERVEDWNKRLVRPMGLKLVELTGDNTPDTRTIQDADIIITTPEKWDGISRSWQTRNYVQKVSLVIIDEIHLLGGDRGPILEIIVSRMNYIAWQKKSSVRLVGMSTACANATDLANWLGVKEGLFNFRHSVRPVPLEIYIDGFPEQRGFCPLMQSMNRPTFLAIKEHSPEKPVIVFVASRRQTRLTARDLINFCGMEDNPRRFMRMPEEDLALHLSRVKDDALREAISFGIGLHHAGLVESDRQLAEELFAHNKIQILIATSTLAWGVNLPAHLVIVKGTQFFDAKTEGYKDMDLTDVLQMLGRAGRPQFDTSGVAKIFTQDAKKAFYKHFLHTGFPVESSLHTVFDNHLAAEVAAGTVTTKQEALDYLSMTFFFRRLHKNPSFYGLQLPEDISPEQSANQFIVDLVDNSLSELLTSRCVEVHEGNIHSTPLGKIMSYYYLAHQTIRMLYNRTMQDGSPQTNTPSTAMDISHALTSLSLSTEFNDLPVRHNEDLINTQLSRSLPLPAEPLGLPLWSPHVKTFLLLQAHFERIDLPISDYIGDQNSVLDQIIRVIQAGVDLSAELDRIDRCREMIALLQCVKSARWEGDCPLSIFPGVDPKNRTQNQMGGSLIEITELSKKELGDLLTQMGVREQGPVMRGVEKLPKLSVKVPLVQTHKLTISIKRLNHPAGSGEGISVYAPRFNKPQTEGFFVLLEDLETGEVLGLRRVSWGGFPANGKGKAPAREGLTIKTVMRLPPQAMPKKRRVKVEVVSDAYIGMKWEAVVDVPAPPVVEEGKKGKERDVPEALW
ncbi:Sec63-domain-containing protein [Piedraia hortae CBS 480.64]|uniref:Sec63-domain-containing protein n=1 Tax=Piedraia hortae CBS 480.64 TaxID=1314780 RepID=A0A6A7BVR8_9PEZI|nr:Sec63-domain-containing protein [Piedraia hortae CBS 480.64]